MFVAIFLNIFTIDLWETFFFEFFDPIKQAPALNVGNIKGPPGHLQTNAASRSDYLKFEADFFLQYNCKKCIPTRNYRETLNQKFDFRYIRLNYY